MMTMMIVLMTMNAASLSLWWCLYFDEGDVYINIAVMLTQLIIISSQFVLQSL